MRCGRASTTLVSSRWPSSGSTCAVSSSCRDRAVRGRRRPRSCSRGSTSCWSARLRGWRIAPRAGSSPAPATASVVLVALVEHRDDWPAPRRCGSRGHGAVLALRWQARRAGGAGAGDRPPHRRPSAALRRCGCRTRGKHRARGLMVRLVVLWCPSTLEGGPEGRGAPPVRRRARRRDGLAPFARPVRLGVLAIPSKGPSRFFGGEPAFAEQLEARSAPLARRGQPRRASGAAEGLFAGMLAARASVLVARGRRPQPSSLRGRSPRCATPTSPRHANGSGLHTLGRFASLEEARVLERFGLDAVRRATASRAGSTVSSRAPRRGCAAAPRRGAAPRRATRRPARLLRRASAAADAPRRGRRAAPRAPARRRRGQRGAARSAAARPTTARRSCRGGAVRHRAPRRDPAAPWPGGSPRPRPSSIPSRAARRQRCSTHVVHASPSAVRGCLSSAPARLEFEPGARPRGRRALRAVADGRAMVERCRAAARTSRYSATTGSPCCCARSAPRWWLAGIYD